MRVEAQALVHIHPSHTSFTRTLASPPIRMIPDQCLGTCWATKPPSAQSPFARGRRYPPSGRPRSRLRGHYSSFLAHTGSCVRPKPSRCLRLPHTAGLCPPEADRQSLLGVGPSRRYLRKSFPRCLDPYPGMPLWCICPFLPRESQPHPRCTEFGASNLPPHCNFNDDPFTGGSHSVMFRLPCLLAPQVAPTAQTQRPTGSQGVYATQWTGSCLPELWYRYMTETDNYHGGTFTRWIAALSAAPCNIKVIQPD